MFPFRRERGTLPDGGTAERKRMIEVIAAQAEATAVHTGRKEFAPAVMRAMATVPRHEFVSTLDQRSAYVDAPLPVGYGQTISQPYIVALMSDLLALDSAARVLDIGTGSGYQAAVLAEIAREVYSVEIVEELARSAARLLRRLGYEHVHVRHGDGYFGWPEHAPYDGILVAAAAPEVPAPLVEQLRPGGRLVIPIGSTFMGQDLTLIEKDTEGHVTSRKVLRVAFVPFTRSPAN